MKIKVDRHPQDIARIQFSGPEYRGVWQIPADAVEVVVSVKDKDVALGLFSVEFLDTKGRKL